MNCITLPNGRSLNGMAYGAWRLAEAADTSVSANLARIDAFSQAQRVPMDRQTWYTLYELANGHEVP